MNVGTIHIKFAIVILWVDTIYGHRPLHIGLFYLPTRRRHANIEVNQWIFFCLIKNLKVWPIIVEDLVSWREILTKYCWGFIKTKIIYGACWNLVTVLRIWWNWGSTQLTRRITKASLSSIQGYSMVII